MPLVAVQEALPTHFPYSSDGTYNVQKDMKWHGTAKFHECRAHSAPAGHVRAAYWTAGLLDEFAANLSLPMLRLWRQAAASSNDHPTPDVTDLANALPMRWGDTPTDCRHWCNPGNTTVLWVTKLHHFLERLREEA